MNKMDQKTQHSVMWNTKNIATDFGIAHRILLRLVATSYINKKYEHVIPTIQRSDVYIPPFLRFRVPYDTEVSCGQSF